MELTKWQRFCRTGKIEDYLRYRGIEPTAALRSEREEAPRHAADNRCADSS